jgi:hypothetical protein
MCDSSLIGLQEYWNNHATNDLDLNHMMHEVDNKLLAPTIDCWLEMFMLDWENTQMSFTLFGLNLIMPRMPN